MLQLRDYQIDIANKKVYLQQLKIMIMETINQIIQQVINSFDFTYCIVVNVLTYILVTVLIYLCRGNVTRTIKKLTLLFSIVIVSVIYYAIGVDVKFIVNSSILAPVSWTWIIKPILSKFGYDYKNIDNKIN